MNGQFKKNNTVIFIKFTKFIKIDKKVQNNHKIQVNNMTKK